MRETSKLVANQSVEPATPCRKKKSTATKWDRKWLLDWRLKIGLEKTLHQGSILIISTPSRPADSGPEISLQASPISQPVDPPMTMTVRESRQVHHQEEFVSLESMLDNELISVKYLEENSRKVPPPLAGASVDLAASETDSYDDFCRPWQMGCEHRCFNIQCMIHESPVPGCLKKFTRCSVSVPVSVL